MTSPRQVFELTLTTKTVFTFSERQEKKAKYNPAKR